MVLDICAPINLLVRVVAVYAVRFDVGLDGVPHFGEHVSNSLRERFFAVLDGKVNLARFRRCVNLARFRRCAHSKCGRVFYAARADQLCCSARCNNARWQALWYADPKHGKSAVYQRENRKQEQER